jgi:hypothetical protein
MKGPLEGVTRICHRCSGTAFAIDTMVTWTIMNRVSRPWIVEVKCERCGHEFDARIGRLEEWCLRKDAEIDFFKRRKIWAIRLLSQHHMTQPGQTVTGKFEERTFNITIGPRKGVRIQEV